MAISGIDATAELEATIGHIFASRELLQTALTHRSYVYETPGAPNVTNERLEFLGDAVLAAVTAEYLFRMFPQMGEGWLTDTRAALVKATSLAEFARAIHLGRYLRLGRGEEMNGGRERASLLADAFEALIGAMLLDAHLVKTRAMILRHIKPAVARIVAAGNVKDDKSRLQQLAQERLKITPTYHVIATEGPAHQRTFAVEVHIGDLIAGVGAGSSKREAEQAAAHDALSREGWQSA
jgi:ribonuclease-3